MHSLHSNTHHSTSMPTHSLGEDLAKKMLGHQGLVKQAFDQRPLGDSSNIRHVREQISQVADFDATVLITGPSGAGKEVVARAIHDQSPRCDKPFIAINCGAIPDDLLESEMFGHEKGAFTGAISSRAGRFELAQGGTLFLDEIGDMPLMMQVKLLRVLQEKCFERVGGVKSIKTDVRIITATHRNLEDSIKLNQFREDLFYRLNVFPINVCSLQERVEDIPVLLDFFISKLDKKSRFELTPEAHATLRQYSWPGNVRELENMVQRLAILHRGKSVGVDDLPILDTYQPSKRSLNEPSTHHLPEYTASVYLDDLNHCETQNQLRCMESRNESHVSSISTFDIINTAYDNTHLHQSESDVDTHRTTTQSESRADSANPEAFNHYHDNDPVFELAHLLPNTLTQEQFNLKDTIRILEEHYIVKALDETGGVVAKAARLLNLRRTTLVEKMRKYGITSH